MHSSRTHDTRNLTQPKGRDVYVESVKFSILLSGKHLKTRRGGPSASGLVAVNPSGQRLIHVEAAVVQAWREFHRVSEGARGFDLV